MSFRGEMKIEQEQEQEQEQDGRNFKMRPFG